MKIKHMALFLVPALACVALALGGALEAKQSVNIPVTNLKYVPTGVTDGVHGQLQVAPAFGDLAHGAHGTFVKMPAGFVSPIHTHTEDYYAVVISGVGVNIPVGGTDVPLPVGSYWFQKGGERHITKCISPNECIFFLSQPGKFDYLPDAAKN
jgi:quercetin dioxygenase-like cupin family protein